MRSRSSLRRVRALCISLGVFAACCLAGENLKQPVHAQEPAPPASGIQGFHLVSSGKGWLLINNQLFWTADNGGNWKAITPDGAQSQKIAAVFFLDIDHAWAGLANAGPLLSNFVLERTADGGVTWETLSSRMVAGEPAIPLSNAVHMQWMDTKTGWLMFEASTSSSFSAGRLFKTVDGGTTWAELKIPVGGSVYFASASSGWAAGRHGDGLYRTMDGGASWRPVLIGNAEGGNIIRQYVLPVFDTAKDGLIPVLTRDAGSDRCELELYSTQDGGDSWSLIHREILNRDSGTLSLIPLDLIDPGHAVVILPHSQEILRMVGRHTFETLSDRDGLAEKIVKIEMLNTALGWAAWLSKDCVPISKPDLASGMAGTSKCASEARLLSTADGGANWASVSLPRGISGLTFQTISGPLKPQARSREIPGLSGTQPFTGQGFDTCMPPSLSEMQDWWDHSPYGVWNLYIGGSNLGCKVANQAAITAPFVSQLHQQGWQFIPTWVGLQASCSSLNVYKMSSDPDTAYRQGVADANAASETVADLGFSHTIVYFDLEYYSAADEACKAAAQAFISGWTAQLHSRGNQAGIYGSACGSGVDSYYTLANAPDAIWPAAWSKSGYDGSASVWGIPCIPDSHWSDHQRILQYVGDHDEFWGNTALEVDSDVLDGIVGLPNPNCRNPRPDGDHIGLYSEENYCGAYTILGLGDYGDPSALGIANDSVSSIKIGKDMEAILCVDVNYLGVCGDFTGNDWYLGDNRIGDNQVSAARVVKRLVLISPTNVVYVLSLRPSFDWSVIPSASLYNIQISGNATFTDLVTNATVTSSIYTPISDLPANRWLFWRARAQVATTWRGWSSVGKFRTPNPPSVPVLSSPANNALTRNYRPPLDWSNSILPSGTTFDHYKVQVDDNLNFSSPAIDVSTAVGAIDASSYTPQFKLAPNATYYWHVRAYNTAGEYSSWSSTWSFRTALLPPVLKAPSDGAQLPNKRPTFSWNSVDGATSYHIQVSGDQAYTQVIWDAACLKTSCAVPNDLPAGMLLFWRVSANGTNGPSAWSSTWSFTTANPPSTPVLTSPANDALVRTYRPRFDWNDSSVPAGTTFNHYRLQIAEDARFAFMFMQADINGDATVSEFTLPVENRLAPNNTYYWRVQAYNTALQYSSWSATWTLRTVIVRPILLAPANGDTIMTRRPAFDWGDVSGASQYQIQISGTSDFSSIYLKGNPVASNFIPALDLPLGTVYWRVMALGSNGPSIWSVVRMFTIQ